MTGLPSCTLVITELRRGWLTVSLNDPDRRNALSETMVEELMSVLTAVQDDRSVRGITLRGEGGVFCAGGDLKSMGSAIMSGDHDQVAAMSKGAAHLFKQFYHQPQTTLVLVEGAAMAGGLGLVCCADLVAVTADAKFALTETRLGIPPAQISPYVVRRLGLQTAKRLMLTGAAFKGADAARVGLADHIADGSADLTAYANQTIDEVLKCAPGALAETKALALLAGDTPAGEMIDDAADAFARCLLSDEGKEGIASFLGKQQPSWAETSDDV